jgi:lipopolysaccharide/colanic/teichoic acid biosynthesis glycosyltransferase
VATAALIAAAVLALLVKPFAVPWLPAYGALIVWSLAASRAAIAVTAHRRVGEPEVTAQANRVPPRSRLRKPALRAAMSALDLLLAIPASLVLLPLMACCAFAAWIGDGGPVLFAQERTGIDGRPFTMFKFRTMRVDAGDSWAQPADERITSAGMWLRRTSLDELPQLWNVIRGEMSLVGPRPEMTEYAARFQTTIPHYDERHAIKPGITGWAQIHYRRNFQPDAALEVARYDFANYSIPLYLYCLAKTACEVFTHRAV